ncbi:hypothetical protein TPHA_0J01350 [Tetrapisispora phaffii CBS 4417]|uniref:Uncharacterized protein n=1 Tax=Tetrapisispora phaffii (strain ATCC 24235 / CBS 4417 / NBRC 1672 / NRRL Y-8282 / UCD 70-5) TaxID=1071381 RepID=G8BYL5_TETPH|nr:hypothetical protein TPHA_0J01350 [Tetrapisispora phaffii CBS 4417]CCE64957.1 hypothetical protein TPHA_0J01350 [Tetrapisispora phaffii CBS 4417]
MLHESLDDLALTKDNIIFFDNFNNYEKQAIDYFTYSPENIDYNLTYAKYFNVLNTYKSNIYNEKIRLPSCSSDDPLDYTIYLKRLINCVFRKWSMKLFNRKDKVDPLDINWKKDSDITVLYGPDLALSDFKYIDINIAPNKSESPNDDIYDKRMSPMTNNDFLECNDHLSRSTSVASSTSSNNNSCNKNLQFKDTVLRRYIYSKGNHYDFRVMINDYKQY